MPVLNKLASGIILHEDFKRNSMIWTPSPENYNGIVFTGHDIKMLYTKTYKTFTIQEPQEDYMFTCEIDHVPQQKDDIAGVIVMRDKENYIECQSYMADTHSYVTNMNIIDQEIIDYINQIIDLANDHSHDKYVTFLCDDGVTSGPDQDSESHEKYVTWQADDGYHIWPEDDGIIPGSYGSLAEDAGFSRITSRSENKTFEDVLYRYIKVVKKNSIYTFFASEDLVKWVEVGNSKLLDSHRIGFFMQELGESMCEYDEETGTITDKGSHFNIKEANFYKSNLVTIRNVKPGTRIQLLGKPAEGYYYDKILTETGRDNVSEIDKDIYIDTTLISDSWMNRTGACIKLIDENSRVYEYRGPVYPGDVYEFSYDLLVSVNTRVVEQNKLFALDAFYDNTQTVRIDFLNREEIVLKDIHVRISAYSVYYSGNETLRISLYDENEEDYDFKDTEVIIDEMQPSEGKSVLVKLTDKIIQDYYMKEGEYRFKLDIF